MAMTCSIEGFEGLVSFPVFEVFLPFPSVEFIEVLEKNAIWLAMAACRAANGPIPLDHPCLTRVSFASHGAERAPDVTWITVAFAVLVLALLIAVLTIAMLLREREAYRAASSQRLRRIWRLAAKGRVWEQAFDEVSAEKREENIKHMERTEAMECGETIFFQAEGRHDPLSKFADASFDAMSRRMDLGEAPRWMRWEQNHHWFAVRTWGGVIWRSLVKTVSASVLELVSMGSCGAGVGKGLLQKMFTTIAEQCHNKIFVVLKSKAGAETFWCQQGFASLSASSVQPKYVVGKPIKQTLDQYSADSAPLKPFVLVLDYGSTSALSTSSTSSTSSMV